MTEMEREKMDSPRHNGALRANFWSILGKTGKATQVMHEHGRDNYCIGARKCPMAAREIAVRNGDDLLVVIVRSVFRFQWCCYVFCRILMSGD